MDRVKLSREYLVHLNWIKFASNPCELDSLTSKAGHRYPEGANSNPAQVKIFQLTSAVSDHHENLINPPKFKSSTETLA